MTDKLYAAEGGQEITEEMIDRWCDAYDRGEFPEGEHTTGGVVYGRPPLSSEATVVITVKVPMGMKKAVERRAREEGVTTSAFARSALAEKLLATR